MTILKELYTALDEKFAQEITILDISKISTLGDYFVILSAANENQVKALALEAEAVLYKNNFNLKHQEGSFDAGWFLMDFGDIIIHIFTPETRDFYNLERLWADSDEIKL